MAIRVEFGRRTLPIGLPTIERAEAAVQRAEAAAETAAADAIAAAQPAIVQATQDAVAGAEAQIAADRQAAQDAATAATVAAQTAAADAAALAAPAAAAAIRDEVKADADRAEVAATGVAADRAKINRLDTAVSEVAAPALMRLTDAQGAVWGMVDLVGGLHLTGLDMSVQGHIAKLMNLRGSDNGSSPQAADTQVIDVVRDAGIDNTGAVSVSTTINQLVQTVAASTAGPKTLFFPRGRYALGSAIIPANGVSFVGAGDNQTVFAPSARESAFNWNMVNGVQNWLTNCTFASFAIDGSGQYGGGSSQNGYDVRTKGAFFQGFRDCRFLNLRIENTWATGLGIDFADRALISGVWVRGCGRGAVRGDPGASGIGIGTGWAQSEPLIITDWHSYDNTNYGVFVERQADAAAVYDARHTIVTNGVAKGNNHAFGEAGCDGTIVSACQLSDSYGANVSIHRGTLNNGPHPGTRTILSSNQIMRGGGAGIEYDATVSRGARGYTSIGNRIEDNTGPGHLIMHTVSGSNPVVDDLSIRGDDIIGNGAEGIYVKQGSFTNFDVLSARLLRNTGAAIRLDGNIRGSALRDAVMRDLRGSATQTSSITGGGNLTDVDIDGCHFVGPNPSPVALTGTQTRVTLGRNIGMGA